MVGKNPSWSEILNLSQRIKVSSRQREIVKEKWKQIVTNIARKISVDVVAREVGVSERTIWRVLRELHLSTKDIIRAYEEHQKMKEEKMLKKVEKVKAPPTDLESFKKLPIIEEFRKYCISRRRVSPKVVNSYIATLYRACKELNVHPEFLNKELIEKYLDDMIVSLGELIREESYAQKVSNIISVFRTWADFRGFSISHKTTEYTGQWNVYFTLEERRALVELARKIFPKDISDFVISMMELYFTTGSRAKAFSKIIDIRTEDGRVEIWVKEKGKKKEYTWKKRVPKELYERVKRYLPLSDRDLDKLRTYLVRLYAKFYGIPYEVVKRIKQSTLLGVRMMIYRRNGEYVEKVIEVPSTKEVLEELKSLVGLEKARKVYYAIRHPLHIWRHTFAISMLEATSYNYEVVAVLGGWVKVNTLERVYGKLEYDKAYAIAFGEFKPKPFVFV